MRHSLCHHQDDSANYVNKLFRKFIRTSEHIKYVDYIVECSLQVLCKCYPLGATLCSYSLQMPRFGQAAARNAMAGRSSSISSRCLEDSLVDEFFIRTSYRDFL